MMQIEMTKCLPLARPNFSPVNPEYHSKQYFEWVFAKKKLFFSLYNKCLLKGFVIGFCFSSFAKNAIVLGKGKGAEKRQ